MFRFKCACCEEFHQGVPSFGVEAPDYYHSIPAEERDERCVLESDICVVDGTSFFVRGCLEIPVHGADEPFSWGVWVSLSENSFRQFIAHFDTPQRSHIGPFFGWLAVALPLYPNMEGIKTRVHLRDDGIRPYIEVEPTDHPLAVEQRNGIMPERVGEIYGYFERRRAREEGAFPLPAADLAPD